MTASNDWSGPDHTGTAKSLPDPTEPAGRPASDARARESEARYRALTEMCPAAILVYAGGLCVFANEAAARLLRAASARELVGRTPYELAAPEYHDLVRERFAQVLERRDALRRVRYRWVRLDGTALDVDVAAAWVQWQGGDAVQIVAHDITEEVLVEEALRESRARLAEELDDARRLHAVSTRLIEAEDTLDLQRALLQAAMALTHADCGSLQEIDGDQGDLRLVAHYGFDDASAEFWALVRAGEGGAACAVAVAQRGRVLVEDVEAAEFIAGTRDHAEFRRNGIRAVQSTPLVTRDGTLLGVMSTHWKTPHRPAARELRLVDILARQAADLLERCRAQERLTALRAFYDSSPMMMGILEIRGEAIIVREANAAAGALFDAGFDPLRQAALDARPLPPAIAATWLAHLRQAEATARPVRFSYEQPTDDADRRLSVTVVSLGEPNGRARFSFIAEDVTDRRRTGEPQQQLSFDEVRPATPTLAPGGVRG